MSRNRDMLSGIQIMMLVNSAIIGVGLLSLPRQATEKADISGVLGVAVAGILAIGLTIIIGVLCKRFPNQTLLDFSNNIVGKFFTKIINLALVAYFTLSSASILRSFADVTKVFLLKDVPIEMVIFSMLVVSSYLTRNGINPIARVCEVFFPIIIISILLFLLLCLPNFDIKELYSIVQIDFKDLVKSMPSIILSYLGFEILLFITAFMSEPQKVIWYGSAGTVIAVAIYFFTICISVGVFSIDSLKFQMYPVLELARVAHLPAGFAERLDIFFAVFWILAVFNSVAISHYIAAFSSTRLFGMRNYRPFCYLILPVIYILALVPKNISEAVVFYRWVGYLGGVIAAIIPIALLVAALVRKKGGAKVEKTT